MKKLILMAALIGLAAGPRRPVLQTPRDRAVNGVRTHAVVPPVITASVMSKLTPSAVPLFVVVSNRPSCWPNCTNVQLQHDWWGFWGIALPGTNIHGYVVAWGTNLENRLCFTNIIAQYVPDGLPHTNWVKFDTAVPWRYYRWLMY